MIEVLDFQVSAGADDIRHKSDHSVQQDNLVFGIVGGVEYSAGLRFVDVQVPRQARILAAYLTHTARLTRADQQIDQDIYGAEQDSAPPFAGTDGDFHRTLTSAKADWVGTESWTQGEEYNSPDISTVIQQIVNRPGWQPGNAIMLFSLDSGNAPNDHRHAAYQYDDDPAKVSKLHIEFAPTQETIGSVVTLHADGPPHRMLAELTTAGRVDRVHALSGKAPFSFRLASSDAQASRDLVREGRLVVIWSTTRLPPYVGRIERVEQDPDRATVEVIGNDLAALLYERQLPLDCSWESQAAGTIAPQMLALANTVNAMGIWPSTRSEPGAPIRGTFDASGSQLGDALDDLAEKTGDEWWLETLVERNRIEVFLRWGHERGSDKSKAIHLQEGIHFSDMEYSTDALGYAASVAVVGGGADVPDRPAAVAAFSRPSASTERGTVIHRASESHVRSRAVSPSLAAERVAFLPLDTDEGVLADAAQRALEEPLTAAEEMDLTINTVLPWGSFGPGDYVQAVLHSVAWGGVSRRVRVMAMQPAEDEGEMDLAVRVKASA